jgi:hypothetical protein
MILDVLGMTEKNEGGGGNINQMNILKMFNIFSSLV